MAPLAERPFITCVKARAAAPIRALVDRRASSQRSKRHCVKGCAVEKDIAIASAVLPTKAAFLPAPSAVFTTFISAAICVGIAVVRT